MKSVVITWGFDPETGQIYLDCYLEITDLKTDGESVQMMELRGKAQRTNLALLRIPKDEEREYIKEHMKIRERNEIVTLLQRAKIRARDITRQGYANQAIDFIMS